MNTGASQYQVRYGTVRMVGTVRTVWYGPVNTERLVLYRDGGEDTALLLLFLFPLVCPPAPLALHILHQLFHLLAS